MFEKFEKFLLVAALLTAGCDPDKTIVRVSPGTDLETVRDRVRELRAKAPDAKVEIVLASGVHRLSKPLVLGPQDSGVAWRGEGDVRLSGMVDAPVGKPVTDERILALLPEKARGKVRVWELATLGLSDIGDRCVNYEFDIQHRVAYNYNQGEAELDSFSPKKGDTSRGILEMFAGDKPLTVAKGPDGERLRIDKALGTTRLPHRSKSVMRMKEPVFTYKGDYPSRWVNEPDPWATGYWSCDWGEQTQQIVKIDPATKTMELSWPPHRWGYRDNQWFFGANLVSELDHEGEYVIDGKAKKVYAWLPENAPVAFSNSSRLLEITGAKDITFGFMTFEGSRGSAISISNCTNVVIARSTIRNCGGYAVMIQEGFDCGVKGCEMHGMGAGGVFMFDENRKTLVASRHFTEDCVIHDFGRKCRMYRPAIWLTGVGQRALHNRIYNAPHAAILFFGNDFEIGWNDISRACYASNDCGVLYTGRSWLLRGTRIHHNYIHDILGLGGGPCNGIYMDDSVGGSEIDNNVFEHVPYAVFIAGTRDAKIHDNVFIDCPGAFRFDARGKNWQKPHIDGRVAEFKKTGCQQWIAFTKPPYSTKYPMLATLMDTDVYAPLGNEFTRNIFWIGEKHPLIDHVKGGAFGKAFNGETGDTWYIGGAARDPNNQARPYFDEQVHDNHLNVDPKTLGWKGVDPSVGPRAK